MIIELDGNSLTVDKLVEIARSNNKIKISRKNVKKIKKSSEFIERMIKEKKFIYGVNKGVGDLDNKSFDNKKIEDFQKYLIYSHSAGWGEPIAIDDMRSGLAVRVNVLSKGYSGVSDEVIHKMVELINKGITPVACQKGSLGSSGDLAPLAQVGLVLMGEGEAFFQNKKIKTKNLFEKENIHPLKLKNRDALSIINGSSLTAGVGSLEVYDALRWLKTSEIAASMTMESLKSNKSIFDKRVHETKGFMGQIQSARNLQKITKNSRNITDSDDVQDAYSIRGTPQVLGAVRDVIEHCKYIIETEINSTADNPLFFPEDNEYLNCANFQGTSIAFALDSLAIAITTASALSERRLNRLLNPKLNNDLPAFLIDNSGFFSGMMIMQYTAASLVNENKILSTPASIGSIPVSGDKEDFVSMGMTSAIKMRQILDNSNAILAIELLASAQALEFRKDSKFGEGVKEVYRFIRKYIKPLKKDRPLYEDIQRMTNLVKEGKILEIVEEKIGKMG